MSRSWRVRSGAIPLDRPLVMGIVNVTPDSFSDGGRYLDVRAAVAHGRDLAAAGADIIDVGGESSRPGAVPVPLDVEVERTTEVVRGLASDGLIVSIDTTKPEVARHALAAGAEIVNDITALADPDMRAVAAEEGAGVVLLHMQGTPQTMQADPRYSDVVSDISGFLVDRAAAAIAAGVDAGSIAVDPGIGFGKAIEHNLAVLHRLDEFVALGYPVVVGASRKRFLGILTGHDDPADRDLASAVTAALVIERGASVVRVHDVPGTVEAARVAWAIVREHEAQWASVGVDEGTRR